MKQSNISVLMAVHEAIDSVWFRLAFESIERQLLNNDEIVLVVDGNVGEALDRVIKSKVAGSRVKCIRNKRNMGLAVSLNSGLKECAYDLVARADADDVSAPERLSLQRVYMDANPDVVVSSGWVRVVSHSGDMLYIRKLPTSDSQIKEGMWRNVIAHSCTIFRRGKIMALGDTEKT